MPPLPPSPARARRTTPAPARRPRALLPRATRALLPRARALPVAARRARPVAPGGSGQPPSQRRSLGRNLSRRLRRRVPARPGPGAPLDRSPCRAAARRLRRRPETPREWTPHRAAPGRRRLRSRSGPRRRTAPDLRRFAGDGHRLGTPVLEGGGDALPLRRRQPPANDAPDPARPTPASGPGPPGSPGSCMNSRILRDSLITAGASTRLPGSSRMRKGSRA